MGKSSPVLKQFLAILCCKYSNFNWQNRFLKTEFFIIEIVKNVGNILSFGFGLCLFWSTINLMELKSENSTFPTGPMTEEQSSIYVSISNIGGLTGNFIILPISQFIGVKNTIHILSVPMIVSNGI